MCFSARAILMSPYTFIHVLQSIACNISFYTLYINLNIQIHTHSVTDDDSWF